MRSRLAVRLVAEARADVAEACRWYENRVAGLGRGFLTQVDAALERLANNPLSCPLVHRGIRRALLVRFPYAVYYLAHEDHIIVLAVLHCRRHPRVVQKRARQ